jgi:anti-sigma regulatory factor (Ser/Thr protein kinase)
MSQTRHYSPEPASVTSARRFVVDCLRGYPQELTDRAELLVSELATNALRHTGTEFTVTITSSEELIRVEVTDPAAGKPHRRHPARLEPNGRGLHIVDALSDSWEVVPARPQGKTVSFVLSLVPPSSTA